VFEISHPPYFPDLTLNYFFLFPEVKNNDASVEINACLVAASITYYGLQRRLTLKVFFL
jgi:hypothetical protein